MRPGPEKNTVPLKKSLDPVEPAKNVFQFFGGFLHRHFFNFRAEYGEKTVQKLNLRIDTIISDLVVERSKTQNVNDQLDETFELFVNN
jgi:hypothetical protein